MEIIKWSPEYSVDISSIDAQHMSLFDALNDFYAGIEQRSTHEALLTLLTKLKNYTVFHFQSEEQLMKRHGFPGYEMHKKEHDTFTQKIEEIENRIKSGKLVISVEITNMVKQWIENHIRQTDKTYSAFLLERGVK